MLGEKSKTAVVVVRFSYACDGVLCPQFFGKKTGQHVYFVRFRNGNKQFRLGNFRLGKQFLGSCVSAHGTHVVGVCDVADDVGIVVYGNNIVIFLRHAGDNGSSDFSATYYNHSHKFTFPL